MSLEEEEKSYLWSHFEFNAEQRLKAFNFFVIFSVFANGGVFSAIDKEAETFVFVLIGGFICLLSTVFFIIDLRSRFLLNLSVPGLIEYEKRFPDHSRLFSLEKKISKTLIHYSVAFRVLFFCQFLFGIGVILYGFCKSPF